MIEFIFPFSIVLAMSVIHFTWLATIVGVLVWISRHLTGRSKARQNYRVGMVGLSALAIAVPLSCWFAMLTTDFEKPVESVALNHAAGTRIVIPGDEGEALTIEAGEAVPVSRNELNGVAEVDNDSAIVPPAVARPVDAISCWLKILQDSAPWISAFYIVGLCLMLVRFGMMLVGCRRILVRSHIIDDPVLVGILQRRATQLGMTVLPAIAVCQRVVTPVIVGIWKPIILLPASMLSGLSITEIEIVLCHELAHLRRHDPLVVLVQRVLETVIFFHPAVWYISRRLDRDRELCCDELVLQAGTSKVAYASALCRVAELAQSKPGGLSLAATGTSSAELLIRVRNILGQPPIQPATTWRWPLILAAIPIGILVTTAMVWISEGNWKTNLPVQKPAVASDGAQDEVQDAGKAESKDFSIRVVDQDGNPVKDASAELTLWNRRGQVMWPKPKPTTNDGTLAFQNSGKLRHLADMVLILANDSDKSHASLMIFKDEEIDRLQYDGTLTVKLEPTMTIFGKVTDIDTGEPVESAKVKVSSSLHEKLVPLSKFTPSVMTALDGTFEMPCVLPGIKGYLVAQHDDYLNPNSLDKPITWTTEKNTFNLQLVPKTISPNTKFPPIVAPDTSGMEPKAAIAKLKAEYKLANDEYSKRIDAKNSVAEQTFALQRLNPNQAYLDAMLKIADANSDPEIEATALAWCCAMLMNSQELDLAGRYRLRTEIGNRIIEKYLDRPEIEDCLDTLIYSQSDGVATARLIVEKNPKHEIQGQCLLLMAESLIQSVDIHRRLKGIGKGNKSEEKVKEKIDDAIDTLVRIKIEYADVPHWRNETLGKMAEMHLDALTKLTPKTTAPEIVGLNQNAEEMKLSDFRGKIVVLEFWEEGISNLAEMNDVAKRHPDDVVMLGVACGPKKSALEAIQKDKVGFQNWIDDGMPGPIARQWNISSFPTTVILDRYGKIRHFNFARIVGAENLRFLVEDILAEESKLPNAMSKLNDSQEPTPDKYAFKPEDYEYDREKGFTVVFKLLIQAEKVNAPAVTIAKLRYDAAKLQRFIALNAGDDEEKDFSKAITILRGVTTNPDKFLVTNESAQFFRNCVGLLTAIYGDKGNSKHEIKTVLESATADIQAAPSLSDHERFMLLSDVRMIASDVALNDEDWPAAIRWVQPIIDDTDKFLNTNEGARGIAMSVRQQSMFLAKNGDAKASADLIDWMCDKLEAASNIDEATRLQLQCMLRGKHLINLTIDKNPEQASAGWEKYQALAKRARAYQGADRANVLKSCLDDMDRLAIGCIYQSDPEKAISIVRDAMALIEAEPELQLASSRVWWSLEDMTRMVCDMPQNPNPEARNLKTDVTEFIQRVKKEK